VAHIAAVDAVEKMQHLFKEYPDWRIILWY